jgi:hypothetical protein
MSAEPMIVWALNGEPLTKHQGAPLRLMVPGWYGVANVKWLSQIHVQEDAYLGKYQARWYRTVRGEMIDGEMKYMESAVTHMNLKSFVARVTKAGNAHKVLGVILGDGTPIKSVEVKIDEGPWQPATLDRVDDQGQVFLEAVHLHVERRDAWGAHHHLARDRRQRQGAADRRGERVEEVVPRRELAVRAQSHDRVARITHDGAGAILTWKRLAPHHSRRSRCGRRRVGCRHPTRRSAPPADRSLPPHLQRHDSAADHRRSSGSEPRRVHRDPRRRVALGDRSREHGAHAPHARAERRGPGRPGHRRDRRSAAHDAAGRRSQPAAGRPRSDAWPRAALQAVHRRRGRNALHLRTSFVAAGETHVGCAHVVGVDETPDGGIDLHAALALLRRRGCARIFIEGGGVTVSMFLAAGLLDRLQVTVAPLLIGDGRPAVRLPPRAALGDCHRPKYRVFRMGGDILFDCELAQEAPEPSDADPEPRVTRVNLDADAGSHGT